MSAYDRYDLETLVRLKGQVGPVARAEIQAAIDKKESKGKKPKYRYSSTPEHLRTEKDVEQDIDAELELFGFDITRLSQPRASKQTRGIPDRYAQHRGRKLRIWIELKTPDGKASADQKRWHKQEREAGGLVWIIRSIEDLHGYLVDYGFDVTRSPKHSSQ